MTRQQAHHISTLSPYLLFFHFSILILNVLLSRARAPWSEDERSLQNHDFHLLRTSLAIIKLVTVSVQTRDLTVYGSSLTRAQRSRGGSACGTDWMTRWLSPSTRSWAGQEDQTGLRSRVSPSA
eukprot:jgi/Botrbrau1/3628/Bobra.0204s0020.1